MSMDSTGSAASTPSTTVNAKDFGAIGNSVRAYPCWSTSGEELEAAGAGQTFWNRSLMGPMKKETALAEE